MVSVPYADQTAYSPTWDVVHTFRSGRSIRATLSLLVLIRGVSARGVNRREIAGIGTLAGASLILLIAVQPVTAGCYSQNDGAVGINIRWVQGTRATVDLEGATTPSGKVIAHPLQASSFESGPDFIGWGTYKGEGVGWDCPDDFLGWNVYVDGRAFGTYHCSLVGVELLPAAQDNVFKVSYGYCPPLDRNMWRVFLNSTRYACRDMDDDFTDRVSAGGEAVHISGASSILHIDVHYHGLEVLNSSGQWADWNSGTECQDAGYRLRRISDTNLWAEEVP